MSRTRRLRVLIVDDDDVDRMAIKRALVKGGIVAETSEAVDFDSARRALLNDPLDCVLLDFTLPGGDGLELLRAARKAEVEVPIIMLTGHGDEALAVDLIHNGAGDYLPKNQLSPERLAQSIHRVLRVRDAERREREAHAALARQADQLKALADISVRIHAALSIEEATDLLALQARALFEAELVLILFRGADGAGVPVVRLSLSDREVHGATDAVVAKASEALLFQWGKSVRLTDAELAKDPEWRALRDLSEGPRIALRGLVAARLMSREGHTLGLILLSDRKTGDFEASDEAILIELSQTSSVAFENARLYDAAQKATRARDDILAIVSHDLRNPLHAVTMSAALLRDEMSGREGELSLLDRIERGTARMNRLIADLLDATRIDAGKLSVTPTEERGALVVKEAIESMAVLADAKGMTLESGAIDKTIVVDVDKERILQLFSNLIGNAIKFSAKGGAITLTLAREGKEACFTVADEGPGVDPAHLEHLFERYWKATEASRDGAGLGLFIARGIVEAHRGRITVESERGRGTNVIFRLPLKT